MKLNKFLEEFNKLYPKSLAFDSDFKNIGLEFGDTDSNISKVLLTLEITTEIVKEAISKKVDLIITHHPFIYNPISKHDYSNYKRKLINDLIKNNINVYTAHTNIDNSDLGMNYALLNILGANNIKSVKSFEKNIARIGDITEIKYKDFVSFVKNKFNLAYIEYIGNDNDIVKKIAICGGSGQDFANDAFEQGADVYISCELKYNSCIDFKEDNKKVINCSHNIEKYYMSTIKKVLTENIKNIDVLICDTNTDPFKVL